MDDRAHSEMLKLQSNHWWFVSRRFLVQFVLDRFFGPDNEPISILELGCGSGGNFDMLQKLGSITGVELSRNACEHAFKKLRPEVDSLINSSAESFLEGNDRQWDLICAFDVLEHIENDERLLGMISAALKKDGLFILTVPAHPWLFSQHDVSLSHFRRYSTRSLLKILGSAGFVITYHRAWLTFLFVPLIVFRILQRSSKKGGGRSIRAPSSWDPLNFLLIRLHRLEAIFNDILKVKIGASMIIVCGVSDPAKPVP